MAATSEKTNKLLANLMAVASGEAKMAELLVKLKNLAERGDVQALAFLGKLEEKHRCPIDFELLEDPVRIEVRKEDDGTLFIEPVIYNRTSVENLRESPTSRRRIERIIDPKTAPKAFKEFYAEACTEITRFFGERDLIKRRLNGSPKHDNASTPPRSETPVRSPLEEQNAHQQSQIEQIRNQCASIRTRMDNILDNANDDSLQTMKSKFQSLLSESTLLNPKITNLSQQMSEVNNDLIRQQQELFSLLSGLQNRLRKAIDIICAPAPAPTSPPQSSSSSAAMSSAQSPAQSLWMPTQTTPAAVSGSPIEPALGQPAQYDYQSPIAPLMASPPIAPPSQQNSSSSAAINPTPVLSGVPQQHQAQYQPVSAQSQLGLAPNLQTPAELQIQIQRLRLEIITEIIDRDPLLKEYFRIGSNNGQITIRESSGLNLSTDNYQRLHQTLRNALNTSLPGTDWTLDKQWIVDVSGQNVQVNRMNLIFPGQNLAAQPQHQPPSPAFFAQPIQSHYPVIQQIALAHPATQLQHQAAQQQQQSQHPYQRVLQPYQQAQQHYQQLQQQAQSQAQQYYQQAQQPYLAANYQGGSFFQLPGQQQPRQMFAQSQQHAAQNENPYPSPFNHNGYSR